MLSEARRSSLERKTCEELHLPTMRQCYAEQGQLAATRDSWTYEQYLHEVVALEVDAQAAESRRALFPRVPKLPPEKSWDAFDRTRLPAEDRRAAQHAARRARSSTATENVLAFGNPGSGKTHLLCALGHELIHRGQRALCSRPAASLGPGALGRQARAAV